MIKCFYCLTLAFALSGFEVQAFAADSHPTIEHAVANLEQTKADLESGEHGFGGHRSAAIEHIDAALKELHLALDYAHEHPEKIQPGTPASR